MSLSCIFHRMLFASLAMISPLWFVLRSALFDCSMSATTYIVNNSDIETAVGLERQHWVVDVASDAFYQTPDNVSSYAPGDCMKFETPDSELSLKYRIPHGLILYRMMYQSTTINNVTVPASAYILLPYARPRNHPGQRVNVIVWAHGTSGVERHCAPSIHNQLYYRWEAPFAMALQGFAVIAPDYAGLGTDAPFHYLAGPAHAADIAYAVTAAHQVPVVHAVISEEWVVVGHSEGGLAAWATNEREVVQPSIGFLGAVSIAPALANLHILRSNRHTTGGRLGDTIPYASYTLMAIARLDPSVDASKYFSKAGLERARLGATGCFITSLAALQNMTFGEVFADQSWLNAPFAKAWEKRTAVKGEKRLAKPMLVIEGLSDAAVPLSVIDQAFEKQCATYPDARVRLSRYPNMDHDPVAFVSQLEYMGWIRELFKGRAPMHCEAATIETVAPAVS